ncbi:hypothetical protein ACN20G_34975 (plasmid) [Streptomyces sp. BI20]|uniref:hypothetical protein n=1 Tax=Streptomyces sp. BI20 TaxID=3403460 RepID=UPI003C73E43C
MSQLAPEQFTTPPTDPPAPPPTRAIRTRGAPAMAETTTPRLTDPEKLTPRTAAPDTA